MTREEILEYFKDINYAYNDCTRYDTLKHMIDELQEPCTDAISRQAVLDLAKFDGRENLGSIIHAFDVEQLPPVKPAEKVGQWIPVSERYPEDGQRVLVDYCDEDAGIMLIRFNVNGYHGFKAWMPLPEPYKASQTGEEVEE